MQRQRSLKSRALQLLAQRDQSRLELRRKLLRHVRSAHAAAEGGGDSAAAEDAAALADAAGVEPLLDWLEANGFLSNARFVESRVDARQPRFGLRRIQNELGQHGVALPAELERRLARSELERAAAVRSRRFAELPGDSREHAAQTRFLLARGFAPEVVHRLMRSLGAAAVAVEPATHDPS